MKFFVQRFMYCLVMMVIIMLISFGVVHLAPNTFLSMGELNPQLTPEALVHLQHVYGLDKPLLRQLLDWLYAMSHCDFGVSFVSGKNVSDEIFSRLGVTLMINSMSLIFTIIIGFILGIYAGWHHNKKGDNIVSLLSLVSFSMPSFYMALMAIFVLAIVYPFFPMGGLHSPEILQGTWDYWQDYAWHLILPVSVAVLASVGSLSLTIRSLTCEILKSDATFFALSRGFSNQRILFYYILPSLKPYLITLLGLSLPSMIGGSVILESLFGIDGMGLLFYQSALSRDYPVVLGLIVIGGMLTLVGNFLADMMQYKLNPYSRI